ncbi:UNVERIFIED_CONTAM: hypothetical protein RMT77_017225 [Armadillidium vulgare]
MKAILPLKSNYYNTVLHNDVLIPNIGFGTYKIKGKEIILKVLEASLSANYRSIDTAAVYRNENDIGLALQTLLPKFNLKRSDIFLTSKLSPKDQGRGKCYQAFHCSLENLQTDYIDLYLIHWPGVQNLQLSDKKNQILREESWKDLEELYKEGKIRSIGVSNFNVHHLESLLRSCSIVPHVNQIEFHPLYKQEELVTYCKSKGIYVQAYSSLGTTTHENLLLNHPIVKQVARLESKSEAQVLLKWALQQGIGVLPKSTNTSHIAENNQLDFSLSDKGFQLLSSIKEEKKFAWDPSFVV